MRGAEHVEEKPIAAPAGPIARLAPGCSQNALRHARSILYFSKDLPGRCGPGTFGPRSGPSRGSIETGLSETTTEVAENPTLGALRKYWGGLFRSADHFGTGAYSGKTRDWARNM